MDKLSELEAEMLAQMEEMPELYIEENQKFIIDNKLRTITMPSSITLGVESDDDVNRLHFQMPQKLGDVDLSKFDIYINYMNANNEGNIYIVEDKAVSGGNITFSWLVGRSATKYKGDTKFIVCMKLCDGRGVVQQEFNTTVVSLKVLEGLEIENPIIDQGTSDTITQLLNIVKNTSEKAVKDVQQEGTTQAGLITKEGEKQLKVLQTAAQAIEVDRQQIQTNKTDIAVLTQSKAPAIICTEKGEHIVVGDSSEYLFDNLKIYGKSTQSGTPTPDVPVPIVSTGDKGQIEIAVHGKQLFDASKLPGKTAGGATVTNNGDGSFTVSGNGKLKESFSSGYTLTHDETIKMLKEANLYLKQPIATKPYFQVALKSDLGNKYLSSGALEITSELLKHESTYLSIVFYGESAGNINPGIIRPMLYQDGDGTWESFSPLQSLSIPTPDGLYGIKIDFGDSYIPSNHTDNTGKKWFCDVIDFKTREFTKNISKKVLNGTETWRVNTYAQTQGKVMFELNVSEIAQDGIVLCDRLKSAEWYPKSFENDMVINAYSRIIVYLKDQSIKTVDQFKEWLKTHNCTVLYMLSKPATSSLTEGTFAMYKKLHTNYPSTVLQNNADAGMELSYVADTKNYIDNKIKEAVSSQIQNTANLLSLMPLSTQATMIENDTNNILDNMEVTKK